MSLLRYANNPSRYKLVATTSTQLIRRFLHLENGPVWTAAKPETQGRQEKVKAFDEMPTRNSNVLQSVYDAFFYMRRKGYFSRPDLLVQENVDKYGPVMRNLLGNEFVVQIVDPKFVEKVFRAEGKYPERMEIKPWKDYRLTRNIPLGLFLK
ncbi:cholesterol side-chain cleavage enzyme, mitochondrial-like [Anneissia japonica]|uniref:cholesterol side-chain cleavage enzyme, mitochondrial-like n=1 Tax=Anneissia japonica TaxID=1529436 RepID=UPI00142585B1|nr:cholesterol side-chain cleavage enzyme, mitochondrial-like [Anneissia japonica]